MALTITIGASPPVGKVISPGPGWLTPIVAVLIGAFAALIAQCVVQLYVVPRVEKRKRREDRWERDVRELGELLAMSLTDLANDAHAAQWVFRALRDDESDEHDPALVDRQARDAQEATSAYGSLIGAQVDWLADRVLSINRKAPEITRFQRVAQDYRMRAIFVRAPPEDDNRTDTAFDEAWEKERAARKALIEQVKLLADLPHPPRESWRMAATDWPGLLGGPDPG
jgi:hypothetical protein